MTACAYPLSPQLTLGRSLTANCYACQVQVELSVREQNALISAKWCAVHGCDQCGVCAHRMPTLSDLPEAL